MARLELDRAYPQTTRSRKGYYGSTRETAQGEQRQHDDGESLTRKGNEKGGNAETGTEQ